MRGIYCFCIKITIYSVGVKKPESKNAPGIYNTKKKRSFPILVEAEILSCTVFHTDF